MARRTKIVTITAEGRDKGKIFHLTEMSASAAERWAEQVFFLLMNAGADVGDIRGAGMAAIPVAGLTAFGRVPFDQAEPILAQMMSCVTIQPSAATPSIIRPLIEDDIEEVATRLFLKSEVLELHTGFSIAASLSTLTEGSAQGDTNSLNT